MYSDKSSCIPEKSLYSGKVVVFVEKIFWFFSGKSGFIRAKTAVFGQSDSIWAKVVVLVKRGFVRAKVVVFGQKWLYSGKVVVIGQK